MANLSASYDKVALGLALVIALALGAMVYLAAGKAEEDFPDTGGGSSNPSPENPNEELFKSTTGAVGTPIDLPLPVTPDGRKITNFVGTPLFLKAENEEAVDLGDASFEDVHPPIPNKWWLDHRIDPGYSDSPDRDPDGDGFTNLDEFNGETNPNDPQSYPSVIAKLECIQLEKKLFRLTYSSDTSIGDLKPADTYKFKHEEIVNKRRVTTNSEWLLPGKGPESNIFAKGGAQLRYELKSVERRVVQNPRNGIKETLNFAQIEDVGGPKKGDKIEIQKGSKFGVNISDYTAVLALAAIGEGGNQFKVAERGSFSLPYDPNAAEKPYTFVGVTAAGAAIIEWQEDGETKSREVTPSQP